MTTIDRAILEELLADNVQLILMALEDAASWRAENGSDEDAEAYGRLLAEVEGWVFE